MSHVKSMHPGIWALAVTAFAIGMAEFVVVAVLPAISKDLHVQLVRASGLVGVYFEQTPWAAVILALME